VVDSHVFRHQKAMFTVVDQIGIDSLADNDGQIEEVGEDRWNGDWNEAVFDREIFERKRCNGLGLSEHCKRVGSSRLDRIGSRHTRLAGVVFAVGFLVVHTTAGKWSS
jgi:hypothetical protein